MFPTSDQAVARGDIGDRDREEGDRDGHEDQIRHRARLAR
jgi:hypothetical protein